MLERTTDKRIADLEGQVKELTEVLSTLIADIDEHRDSNSCFWWKESFLKDLEVSDELKESLGLRPNKEYNEDVSFLPTPREYECKPGGKCRTCNIPCVYMQGRYQAPSPRMGRIHHPPLRMPMPNLIRKAGDHLDDEIIGKIWRNIKWKEIPGSEDTDQK